MPYNSYQDGIHNEIPMGFFFVVSTLLYYCFALFAALGLACALFYIAELAEEHTVFARLVMKSLIVLTTAILVLLKVVDGFSWWRCLLSIAGQGAYYQLLVNFPWVSFKSPAFIASCGVFIMDHFIWHSYFLPGEDGEVYPHWAVLVFFLMLWMVPVGFFCTLAVADQNALPATLGNETAAPKRRTFASIASAFLPRSLAGDKTN